MAMGKAVITAKTKGISEMLRHGENAFLCNAADPRDLSQAVFFTQFRRQRNRRGASENVTYNNTKSIT